MPRAGTTATVMSPAASRSAYKYSPSTVKHPAAEQNAQVMLYNDNDNEIILFGHREKTVKC